MKKQEDKSTDNENKKNSINQAIEDIDKQIVSHRKFSISTLLLALIISVGILYTVFSMISYQANLQIGGGVGISYGTVTPPIQNISESNQKEKNTQSKKDTTLGLPPVSAEQKKVNIGASAGFVRPNTPQWSPQNTIYIMLFVFVIVFGVFMAIYRFHLSEISRSQQYRFGLQRIRIAANNYETEGFRSEVRESLTSGAFDYSTGKGKKVESPLPGHPTSDIATMMLNKFFDKFDLEIKPSKKTSQSD